MKALVEAQLYRDAGGVKRYHVKRTHRTQTVAEHTFGMLMLVKQVLEKTVVSDFDKSRIYEAVLHHDLPELFTGDIPAPIKRAHPQLGPLMNTIEEGLAPLYLDAHLGPWDAALIKWADRMELVLWCLEEIRMGNTFLEQTAQRGLGWILASVVPECALELTEEVVADARSLGINPDVGSDLEKNA